jgi:hypothetical protein
MKNWPLLQRNKVEDSKVDVPVGKLAKSEDENIRTLAQALLDQWAALETGYRIPKRSITVSLPMNISLQKRSLIHFGRAGS